MSRMSFQGTNFQSLYLVLCGCFLGRLENSIKRILAVFLVTPQLNPLMTFCRNTILVVKIYVALRLPKLVVVISSPHI